MQKEIDMELLKTIIGLLDEAKIIQSQKASTNFQEALEHLKKCMQV